MDLGLGDRVVLITGGTDGLGLALAKNLVAEGARVAVCGRDAARLERAQELLGSEALCVEADVTNASDREAFVADSRSRFGRIDALVNNAGRSAATLVANSDDDEWRADYELKVVSALHLARLVLDDLAVSGGVVLNVLAISARAPGAGSTPTAASRAAGLAMTKALANEVGPRGVRALAILIGLIESGQWERRAAQSGVSVTSIYQDLARNARVPLGRVGRAEEFANLATFLVSPRASYVTGVGVSLDGGLSPVI
ncbi:MAG: SDR family oxidoreductase [Actinomycetales bacterium]|nr:SDR family oxidoreductase [Actinomycetales bacterium]